jgi:hypothetical protein
MIFAAPLLKVIALIRMMTSKLRFTLRKLKVFPFLPLNI